MNVLSLFDGISAGQVALERTGIKVDKYFASEIDKHAINVTQANYPDTIQLGDVREIKASDLPEITLLIGGSPCQGFSFAGKQLAFNDERSALFFEYVRLLKECKPKYFMLENVRMKKEHLDVITEQLGVEPILINSALVSAQNRNRYYWTNIQGVTQPEDKKIFLKDIIETGLVDRDKSHYLDASYFKGGNPGQYFNKSRRQLVFKEKSQAILATIYKENAKSMVTRNKSGLLVFNYSSSGRGNGVVEGRFTDAEKALTLTATGYSNRSISAVMEDVENYTWRKLTPLECERLQTFPDNYTNHVSNTQRYKALGNSWTVDVVAHILKGIK